MVEATRVELMQNITKTDEITLFFYFYDTYHDTSTFFILHLLLAAFAAPQYHYAHKCWK